jgi:hypothetical protein
MRVGKLLPQYIASQLQLSHNIAIQLQLLSHNIAFQLQMLSHYIAFQLHHCLVMVLETALHEVPSQDWVGMKDPTTKVLPPWAPLAKLLILPCVIPIRTVEPGLSLREDSIWTPKQRSYFTQSAKNVSSRTLGPLSMALAAGFGCARGGCCTHPCPRIW